MCYPRGMSVEHPELLWCVEFHHVTVMWNEGFHHADFPWCTLYTPNEEFASALSGQHIPFQAQDGHIYEFKVKVYQTVMPEVDPEQTAFIASQDPDDEYISEYVAERFLGFVDGSYDELADKVADRLSQWDGI